MFLHLFIPFFRDKKSNTAKYMVIGMVLYNLILAYVKNIPIA